MGARMGRSAGAVAQEHGAMDHHDALEQLRADIFEVFPPGPQRDIWLKWLEELSTDSLWHGATPPRTIH
jgi:hypothetical protein